MMDSIDEQASYQTREEFLASMGERWDRVNKTDTTPPIPEPTPGSLEEGLERSFTSGLWAMPSGRKI